ncbi:MAG TPA: hypothetical protein VHO69_12495 [Phototrophicaceae bacterium]|nr:hypothetical protein [Phototrophicaceae bacterium]
MVENSRIEGLFLLAELSYLRAEAMDLFERGLTEGTPDYLMGFIEEQIAQEPPRLDVLRELAEDLHQRLLGLREYHFDVRERVLRTLRDDFHIDLSLLAPANALDRYHKLELEAIIQFLHEQNPALTRNDDFLLRKMLEASLEMAAQLHEDVTMTQELFHCVMDWIDGLSATLARRFWLDDWLAVGGDDAIIH